MSPATGASPRQTSDEVAAEIVRVQLQAESTADAWQEADFRAEGLDVELAVAEQRLAEATATFDSMRSTLGDLAVERFTEAGAAGPIVFFTRDPMTQIERDTLRTIATQQGALDVDEYADVQRDLVESREAVDALRAQVERSKLDLEQRLRDLEGDLENLEQLRVRLKDAEVKRAYEARMAAIRKAQEEEAARIAAERQAAEEKAAAERAAAERSAKEAADAAAADVGRAQSSQASAMRVEGGPSFVDAAPQVFGGTGFRCPVAGPNAFGDTWGAARSGGRRHKGVDMMSPEGTPLVAVVSGFATMKFDKLGGIVVSLNGDDGARYYYAHLVSWEGSSRPVQAGEVVGYVGHTGNTDANHLHFEIHPGGGAAVNPYPTVRAAC